MPPRNPRRRPPMSVQDQIKLVSGMTASLCLLLLTIAAVYVAIRAANKSGSADTWGQIIGGLGVGGVATGLIGLGVVLRNVLRDSLSMDDPPPQEPN